MLLTLIPLLASVAVTLVNAGRGFTGQRVMAGYWPSYGNMAPSEVPYKYYTHLDYFVFTTTSDINSVSTAGEEDSKIFDFVQRAHAAGITTSYVIGGWTGSKYFSQHVSTSSNRQIFAQTLVKNMQKYGFDGIDIDWEYPGQQGIGDNIVSPSDSANFGLFLGVLRALVPNARLSIAANVGGIVGPDGGKVQDLNAYAAALDYVTIMAYDVFGPWSSTTGPNGPLYDSCSTADGRFSGDRAVQYFVSAGFAKSHLLLGFPAYSYSSTVTAPLTTRTCPDGSNSNLYQEKRTSATCGNWIGDGPQYLYRDLVQGGFFPVGRHPTPWTLYGDKNSKTALLYNSQQSLFIPTETMSTATAKGVYIRTFGLGGFNTFSIDGDTDDLQLVTAQRNGLRLRPPTTTTTRVMRRHHEQRGH